MPELRTTIYLPPDATVRAWQARDELQPTVRWSEMIHEQHAAAFTVAKVAKLDLLVAIQKSLDKVIREGGTFEQWKADILPELQRQGWWGVVQDRAVTGTDDPIIVNDRRLRNIYRTNIRMSMAAGRWARFLDQQDIFPYIRYRSDHPRRHPRADHLSWHGLILPVGHPWWQTHFPPNGWGCNCKPEQVSDYTLRAKGWKVGPVPDAGPDKPFYPAGRDTPVMVPEGVEPGFGYNPGTAFLRVIADKALASINDALTSGLEAAARQILTELLTEPVLKQFLALPSADFPIAIVTGAQARVLGGEAQIIRLLIDTTLKVKSERVGDYAQIAKMVDAPTYVLRINPRHVALFEKRGDSSWYRLDIQVGEAGDDLYVLNYKPATADNIDEALASYERVDDWL